MWLGFSNNARRIVFEAQEFAAGSGTLRIDTEHLLAALLQHADKSRIWPPAPTDRIDAGDTAAFILRKIGVDLSALCTQIEQEIRLTDARLPLPAGLTSEVQKVINLSYEEARSLGHSTVGLEHLLLGLVREENGMAGRVLRQCGVGLEAVRSIAVHLPPGSIARAAEKTPGQKKRTIWQHLFG